MTTTRTARDVRLPAGAVSTEEWQPYGDDTFYRCFTSEEREITTGAKYSHGISVFSDGTQWDDGRIEDGSTDRVFDAPRVYISEIHEDGKCDGYPMSADAARRLADLLVMAADEVDGVGSPMTTQATNGQNVDTVTRAGWCIVDCGWADCEHHGPYCGADSGIARQRGHRTRMAPNRILVSVINPYINGTVTRSHARDCDRYRDGVQLSVNVFGEIPVTDVAGFREAKFNLTPAEARQLAAQLIAAADSHDRHGADAHIMHRLEKIAERVGADIWGRVSDHDGTG